jgi:dephospho-CoA kinase
MTDPLQRRQPGEPQQPDEPRRQLRPPLLIGLTGPIGCGKSTVGRMLAELGGTVIDADVLARRATEAGRSTLPAIRERFGDGVFDEHGNLDRAAMARIVFQDALALADDAPFVVIEAIKLVEGGLAQRCNEVWLVECQPVTQRSRLVGRGDSEADAARRIETQGPDLTDRLAAQLAEGRGEATEPTVRRLSTDATLEELTERVEDLLAEALLSEDQP